MNKLYYISLLVLALTGPAISGHAQIVVTENISADTAYKRPVTNNNITINADPRLAILVERHKNLQYGGIRHMRGYRVQIYYGNDRAEAIRKKVDFMRRYPRIQTYMVYTQPQYRVKVGDFATREDALELYRETLAIYGACIIVPDNVTINTAEYYD
ncbi:MAG: SPOR domain-containing protein [Chitinophagales bacterium]|nr:SPOR domain-containing protein [Chitinophagales bacterium]